MTKISGLSGLVRRRALAYLNHKILADACRAFGSSALPSYIVVTPHLVHLAPLAARNHTAAVQPVFVTNGLTRIDLAWLQSVSPHVPVIPLRASLGTNPRSLVEHGVVINHLARASLSDFYIQDADCFISDPEFWASMRIDPSTEYAVGPFMRVGEGERPDFPETFLLCLNRALMEKYRRRFGVTAEPTGRPGSRARRFLASVGYAEGKYLETLKDYFDTLQQFWVAARHEGFQFRLVPGNGTAVHHVGGTSYLFRTFDNLDHWDYWPLNVHYFHLKLLEQPRCSSFRARFRSLIDFHGSSDALLGAFPAFAAGWRRRESDTILDSTGAVGLYSAR